MQNRRIEIRTVRPNESMDLGINGDGGECRRIAKRSVDLSLQYFPEVDLSGALIIEADPQSIAPERLH